MTINKDVCWRCIREGYGDKADVRRVFNENWDGETCLAFPRVSSSAGGTDSGVPFEYDRFEDMREWCPYVTEHVVSEGQDASE